MPHSTDEEHPLVTYAKDNDMTMTEIAQLLGCTRQTLYNIVRGKTGRTRDGLLMRISKMIGVADHELAKHWKSDNTTLK